jgi:hypothetical protein
MKVNVLSINLFPIEHGLIPDAENQELNFIFIRKLVNASPDFNSVFCTGLITGTLGENTP